jgi:membrane protein
MKTKISPELTPPSPPKGRLTYYLQGSWAFFRRMWPSIYELTTTEAYVSASAIAFNVLLSFFSFLVLVGSFLINVLHWQRGYETFYLLLRSLVPKESAQIFWSLDRVTLGPGGRATVVSFGLLIFSSMGIFQPIEMAFNRAWGFRERGVVRQYLVYLALVAGCAALLLLPITFGSFYNATLEAVSTNLETRAWAFRFIGPVISLPFLIAIFFFIYYVVPNGRIEAGLLVFPSIAMAVLWVLMTLLFRLLLPLFDFEEAYHRLATLMALVTWVFISSYLLLLGAHLTSRQVLPRAWSGDLPFFRRRVADRGREEPPSPTATGARMDPTDRSSG